MKACCVPAITYKPTHMLRLEWKHVPFWTDGCAGQTAGVAKVGREKNALRDSSGKAATVTRRLGFQGGWGVFVTVCWSSDYPICTFRQARVCVLFLVGLKEKQPWVVFFQLQSTPWLVSTPMPSVIISFDVAADWLSGNDNNQALPYYPLGHCFRG